MDPNDRVAPRRPSPRDPTIVAPVDRQHSQRPSTDGRRKKVSRKRLFIIAGVVIPLALALFALSWFRIIGPLAGVKNDRYQAVFLTNDQVYFGKVISMTSETITLRDVYYLKQKNGEDTTKTDQSSQQVQLAKLGASGEVHNPDNEMRINRTQVLFWENMKDDSQVVKTIKQAP